MDVWYSIFSDITSHLNDLNLKLHGKDKSFPSIVNDISAIKIKLKLFISQLENKDLSQFRHLKGQSECAEDNANFTEYMEKIIVLQKVFDSRFIILLKKKTACLHL